MNIRAKRTLKAAALLFCTLLAAAALPAPAQASTQYALYGVRITNPGSGLNVDVQWANRAPGAGAFLWPSNTNLSQRFDIIADYDFSPLNGDPFVIKAEHSGLCLMPNWSGPGAPVVQLECPTSLTDYRARWHLTLFQIFQYGQLRTYTQIESAENPGQCLDVANSAGGVPQVQAPIQTWDCMSDKNGPYRFNQAWTFSR
jgi:hypothetical protein